jgi:hypothetical protein
MTTRDADPCDPAGRRTRARATLNALLARYDGGRRSPGRQELIDSLFVEAGDGTGWLAGIAELSVSFRAGRPVTIRSLSEFLRRRTLDPALATAGLRWGAEMFRRVSSSGSGSYAVALFRDIYEMIYLRDVAEPAPPFRFGIATEFGGESPILKVYFDLHATRAEHRRHTLERIADLLGETSGLDAWKRECPEIDLDKSRVIGVDFGAGNTVRSKFYWGARPLTWDGIVAASRRISGERHTAALRRLEREVIGVSGALSSVLISMCCANGERSMKLDLCVARLYENDGEAFDAIERFRGAAVDGDGPAPLKLVTGGLEPRRTKCVQQYLGVEFPPERSPRVSIYYRPIGLETEHLNPALRPRMCT